MIVQAEKGDNFYGAVRKVKEQIYRDNQYLDLEFNNIRVRVSKDSNIDDLATIYDLKRIIERMKLGYRD
jgi:hypothetical protein